MINQLPPPELCSTSLWISGAQPGRIPWKNCRGEKPKNKWCKTTEIWTNVIKCHEYTKNYDLSISFMPSLWSSLVNANVYASTAPSGLDSPWATACGFRVSHFSLETSQKEWQKCDWQKRHIWILEGTSWDLLGFLLKKSKNQHGAWGLIAILFSDQSWLIHIDSHRWEVAWEVNCLSRNFHKCSMALRENSIIMSGHLILSMYNFDICLMMIDCHEGSCEDYMFCLNYLKTFAKAYPSEVSCYSYGFHFVIFTTLDHLESMFYHYHMYIYYINVYFYHLDLPGTMASCSESWAIRSSASNASQNHCGTNMRRFLFWHG